MSFSQRLAIAKDFELGVERYLLNKNKVHAVVKNGTEHTHPEFVDKLRSNDSIESKFIRFAPDGIMLLWSNKVVHWEAKASNNMERDAYETYMKYHSMGCCVVIFIRQVTGNVYWQHIEKLGFKPSSNVVGKFPENRRHPLDENDWICPRRGHGYAGFGSGTDYKEINFSSTNMIEDFYD